MSKPNVIMIYCDELRTDALGCYGHQQVAMLTPNIDRLATIGSKFTNCFCNSPVCVPSRTAQLTGLYPEQTGIYHNEAYWSIFELERRPTTFPQLLAEHGYTTANFGKEHIPRELSPWMHSNESGASVGGGNENEFLEDYGCHDWIVDRNRPWIILGGTVPDGREFAANRITQNAIRWLSETDGTSFTRLSFLQPHTPVLVPKPFNALYNPDLFRDECTQHSTSSTYEKLFGEQMNLGCLAPEEIQKIQSYYYGLTAWIDEQVGILLNYLENSGQLQNTIIIFESDHGVSLGENGRFHKLTFAPESHRVPRIISWPETLPQNKVREDINQSIDLAPTLSDLLEIDALPDWQGRSLFSEPEPDAVFSTIGYGFDDSYAAPFERWGRYSDDRGWPRRTCIRTSQYRMDKNVRLDGKKVLPEDEDIYLADVKSDCAELNNIANHPELKETVSWLSSAIDTHASNAVEPSQSSTQRNPEALARHSKYVASLSAKLNLTNLQTYTQ